MSDENGAEDADAGNDLLSKTSPVMLAAITVGITLFVLVTIISFVMTLSLSGDVAHLRDQVHKADNSVKNLEKEIALLRSVQPTPAAAKHAEPAPAPAKPSHIDAVAPGKDCVIRAGSKDPFADCLK